MPATEAPSAGPTRPWPVRREFPVAYHDVDALNHLNHAAYFVFMETLRCDYYLPLLGHNDPTRLDIIIAEASCRYLAPAFYNDVLVGEVAPATPPGRTSLSLLYRFRSRDGRTTYARGRTVVVMYDYAAGAKKEIPRFLRERIDSNGVDPSTEGW